MTGRSPTKNGTSQVSNDNSHALHSIYHYTPCLYTGLWLTRHSKEKNFKHSKALDCRFIVLPLIIQSTLMKKNLSYRLEILMQRVLYLRLLWLHHSRWENQTVMIEPITVCKLLSFSLTQLAGGKGWSAKSAPKIIGGTIDQLIHRVAYHRVLGEWMISIATVTLY